MELVLWRLFQALGNPGLDHPNDEDLSLGTPDGETLGHPIQPGNKPSIFDAVLNLRFHLDEPCNWETAMTRDEAWKLANDWVAAWNSHDLDAIMTHYEDAIELTSPTAARLLGTPDGKVVGKANLRAYFQRGLEAYPELQFHLEDVLWGVSSLLLCYRNQNGTRTGEFMELSAAGKVARVVANYSA